MTPAPEEKGGAEGRPDLVYRYGESLYLSITNRCPTACVFCIKGPWKMGYRGYDLRLREEPSVAEILAALGDDAAGREVVFCGYGECTYRLDAVRGVSTGLREREVEAIRLNTIGLGNLINGRDITGELARCLDSVTVSLNTADARQWARIHRPLPEFHEEGHAAVVEFIRGCVKAGLRTIVTALETPALDMDAVRTLAGGLGAEFRSRPVLEGTPESKLPS